MRNCALWNIEIPQGAIALLRSGPSDYSGMTGKISYSAARAVFPNIRVGREAREIGPCCHADFCAAPV
jgi:hypothetical protein